MLLKSRIFTFVTGLILITNPITFSAALAQEVTPQEQKPTDFESVPNKSVESFSEESTQSVPNESVESFSEESTQSVTSKSTSAPGCSSSGDTRAPGKSQASLTTNNRVLELRFTTNYAAFAQVTNGDPGDVIWIDRRNNGKVTRYCGKTTIPYISDTQTTTTFYNKGTFEARACITPLLYVYPANLYYYAPESCTAWK